MLRKAQLGRIGGFGEGKCCRFGEELEEEKEEEEVEVGVDELVGDKERILKGNSIVERDSWE